MSGIQHSYLQHLQQLTVLYVEDDDDVQRVVHNAEFADGVLPEVEE